MKAGAGETAAYNPDEGRVRDSGSRMLYEAHTDADGHVTVTCHCPRCEAEREREASLPPGAIGRVKSVDGDTVTATVDLSHVPTELLKDYVLEWNARRFGARRDPDSRATEEAPDPS